MSLSNETLVVAETNSFWDIDGYIRAVKRTENGAQMCSELSKFILERAEIERDYAKRLKAWAHKWREGFDRGPEYGSNKQAICATLVEADHLADVHLTIRDRLVSEINPQIKDWKTDNYKKQLVGGCKEAKSFEDDFRKVQKPWAKKLAKVVKAKRDYYTACKLAKSAINQENNAKNSSDVSVDQLKKFEERVMKCHKDVETNQEAYRVALYELNVYNAKYMEEMNQVFQRTQEFEVKRLTFIKKLLYDIHNCLDLTQNKQVPEIYHCLRQCIDASDAMKDVHWWSENYGASMTMSWPQYEEYNGEFRSITSKQRGCQSAHIGGTGDGVTLRSIQRSEDAVSISSGLNTTAPTTTTTSHGVSNQCQNPFGDDDWDEYENLSSAATTTTTTTTSGVPEGVVVPDNNVAQVKVRALYDYNAQEEDELTFKAGDVFIKVRDRDEQGWCAGRIAGKIGLYPDNYVEIICA